MKQIEFSETYRNRHKLAEDWKKSGKKIFGYFCNYTPEEIIYAAGIIPVRIRGGSENIDLADAHLPSICCSYMRSALDQALKGRFNYLDGAVFPKSCDMTRALYSIWKRNIKLPYYWNLPIPGKSTDAAVDFFIEEMALFKESLEKYTGKKIGVDSLKQAITLYNQNRALVRELYNLALRDNPPLSGSEVFEILRAGLVISKEEHNAMLRKLLPALSSARGSQNRKVRLMIAGNTFETVELLQAIEESGANVVIDDIDIGSRYYFSSVNENEEPLRALAERYLHKVLCPCKHDARHRVYHMLKLAKDYRVEGIILLTQKYCDTHLYDRPWLESKLKDEGFPVLVVDHSDIGWVGGKFKTMVQAFIEMVG